MRRVQRTIVVTKRSLILALWGLVVFVYLYYALRAELPRADGGVRRPASLLGGVAGVGRSPRADRARAAPPPAPPGGAGPPAAGPQHLAVLRLLGGVLAAGGAHYARIGFSLNAAQFDAVIAAFVGRPGPAGGVGGRPSPARLRGHQRGRGPAVGLPRSPARPDIRLAHGCGRARLATDRRVVRVQRRPQRPAQRSLPEREQRRRLPADWEPTGEPTPEEQTPRSPTTPASACQCWRRPTDGSSR